MDRRPSCVRPICAVRSHPGGLLRQPAVEAGPYGEVVDTEFVERVGVVDQSSASMPTVQAGRLARRARRDAQSEREARAAGEYLRRGLAVDREPHAGPLHCPPTAESPQRQSVARTTIGRTHLEPPPCWTVVTTGALSVRAYRRYRRWRVRLRLPHEHNRTPGWRPGLDATPPTEQQPGPRTVQPATRSVHAISTQRYRLPGTRSARPERPVSRISRIELQVP